MTKTFSTKLNAKVIHLLDRFCTKHHLKKTHLLEELIEEGLKRREEAMELALSLQKGLEDEKSGDLYPAEEVEKSVFHTKKAR